MNDRPLPERWRMALWALCSVAMLVSCGGGVDSGGTGAPTALAAGPVSGLGSVIVNGVRFDDSAATILDADGNALTADQVQVGMALRIDASAVQAAAGLQTATALAVRVGSEIVGPIDSISPLGTSIVVLGQSVRITVATWFDSALPGGVAALTSGQVVEVHGQYNARTNEYIATRILPRISPASYGIRGLLGAVDSTAQTLTVGGLTISYASIGAGALPTLTVGRFVRVALGTTPNGSVWNAMSVVPGNTPWPDRPDVRVLGRISNWTSAAHFSVNGVVVDASAASFPAGQAGVVLGARVAVTGTTSGGVLTASTVTVRGDETAANSTFEFHGAITALNTAAQTLKVRGITVNYTPQVQFSGGAIGDLAVGKTIDVVGTLASNRTSIDAQTISFY